jgi:hypothetical protein
MTKRDTPVLSRTPHRRRFLSAPRGDVFMPPLPQRQLPVRQTSATAGRRPAWLFVAAHGGSGATLLARLSAQGVPNCARDGEALSTGPPLYGMAVGRAWPNPQLEPTGLVVVVCQTTMRGLGWARDVAAQYLSGTAPAYVHVLGVVTIADQPGRLPQPIAAARGLLAGAYPHTWHVPYVPEYRLLTGFPGEPCPPIHPAVEDVLAAIRSTANPKGRLS